MREMQSRFSRFFALLLVACLFAALLPTSVLAEGAEPTQEAVLKDGVNVVQEDVAGLLYRVDAGKILVLKGTKEQPLTLKNCKIELSGETMFFSGTGVGYNGESRARLAIGDYVTLENCEITAKDGSCATGSGNDACIEFFGVDTRLVGGSILGENWAGQFLGLFGAADVTLSGTHVRTTGVQGTWSYAMYGTSVLRLEKKALLSARGMTPKTGNVNAFYSGDLSTSYDAVFLDDATVDFSENKGGGFALNNINIHVKNSTIRVENNAGNASNSGYWIVEDSKLYLNGNRGGHALSCVGAEMKNTTLQVLHNGYAGVYIQSQDSKFENCTVDVRCNGERLKSYSAGDLWTNDRIVTFTNCPHVWIGGVSLTRSTQQNGRIVHEGCAEFVAEDLGALKGRAQVLAEEVTSAQTSHTLFVDPSAQLPLARGVDGGTADLDLLALRGQEVLTGKASAKIKALSEAQLSHHRYDWTKPETMAAADAAHFGLVRYACTDVCADYVGHTENSPNSFDCAGTYVYAPLVGLAFDANAGEDAVENLPAAQSAIAYAGKAASVAAPTRRGYRFLGWYLDAEGKEAFSFDTSLKENWTVVYAKWEKVMEQEVVHAALTVRKVDAAGVELAGAVFGLYDTEACTGEPILRLTAGTARLSTDDAALAELLPASGESVTLYLKELSAPVGYRASGEVFPVMLQCAAGEEVRTDDAFVTTLSYSILANESARLLVVNEKLPETPKTGEDSRLWMFSGGLLLLTAAAAAVLICTRKRRRPAHAAK